MKIPNSIKIGGTIYKVKFQSDAEMNGNNGYVWVKHCIIKINTDIPKVKQEEAFLHELLHAISDENGLELGEDKITPLAWGLYQILKDNKIIN